jgi:hypothetical protein
VAEESKNVVWQDLPGAEDRLEQLRDRDLELSQITLGLQMRTRITTLEQENAVLRSMEKTWSMSRVSRLYFTLPRIFRAVAKKFNR